MADEDGNAGLIQNLPKAAAALSAPETRPEEIIAFLWGGIRRLREAGKTPGRIILSPEDYRRVRAWHIALGELSDPSKDYITKHTIFNLPVYVETGAAARVEE